jgi:hypothetical protein
VTYITRSDDHHYTFDGVTYPGVTGVVKVLDKSGPMMAWASRMTAEAAVSMVDTLPHLLDSVGAEGVVKALTARSAWKRDEAAALGTEVHRIADLIATGRSVPAMTETTEKRVDHYTRWWLASGWTVRASEAMVVHPSAGYGGTLDIIAKDREGRTVLADYKTGNVSYQGRLYPEILMQLAAYGMAEWLDMNDGAIYAMPHIDRYAVVHITADGCEEIEAKVGDAERAAFRDCLSLTLWREGLKGKRL